MTQQAPATHLNDKRRCLKCLKISLQFIRRPKYIPHPLNAILFTNICWPLSQNDDECGQTPVRPLWPLVQIRAPVMTKLHGIDFLLNALRPCSIMSFRPVVQRTVCLGLTQDTGVFCLILFSSSSALETNSLILRMALQGIGFHTLGWWCGLVLGLCHNRVVN